MPEKNPEDRPMTLHEAGKRSWTAGNPEAERPRLDEETRREVERIRQKQARGEELTTHEAGILGGATRVQQARGEERP